MKILHLCLSCFYLDGHNYQENLLPLQHHKMGHKVKIIASTYNRRKNNIFFTAEKKYINEYGINVERIAYSKFLPRYISYHLKVYDNLKTKLIEFNPDIIIFHGMCSLELITVYKYLKKKKNTKFFIDTHTDFLNSAKNIISKWFLHFLIFKNVLKIVLNKVEKIFYISDMTYQFAKFFYKIPSSKLEFLPLGGIVHNERGYKYLRNAGRKKFNFKKNEIIFTQIGKQTQEKKLLLSLKSFSKISKNNYKFIIAGSLDQKIKKKAIKIINQNNNIKYIGWLKPNELDLLFCAADFYLQPGEQSCNLQHALCCRCIPIISNLPGHNFYTNNMGWIINKNNDFINLLKLILNNKISINLKKKNIIKFSNFNLNYFEQAKKFL